MSQMTVTTRTFLPRSGVARAGLLRHTRTIAASPVRSGTQGFVMTCVLLVLLAFAAVLMLNTWRAEGSFDLARLQSQHTALNDTKVSLQNELSNKESAQNLARQAERMKMVPSTSTASLRLSDGTITGVASKVDGGRAITVDLPSTGLPMPKDD